MTSPAVHVILRREWRILAGQAEVARALMDEASHRWQAELARETERLFDEAAPAGRQAVLDRVELDLGTIPVGAWGRELLPAYRAALTQELHRLLAAENEEGRSAEVGGRGRPGAVEHALRHGWLPWWCPDQSRFDAPEELRRILRHQAPVIAALARRAGTAPPARFRLVQWLADPEMHRLVRALLGRGEAEFVVNYAEELDHRRRERWLPAASVAAFRQVKWEVILGYLLDERGSQFNRKEFVRQTLRDLARRYGFDYQTLLGELATVARSFTRGGQPTSFQNLLHALHDEDVVQVPAPVVETGGAGAAAGAPESADAVQTSAPPDPAQPWLERWEAALRESPAEWSDERRSRLEFWTRARPADAAVAWAWLAGEAGLAERLAALCTMEDLAVLHTSLTEPRRALAPGFPVDAAGEALTAWRGVQGRLREMGWPRGARGRLALVAAAGALDELPDAVARHPLRRSVEEWLEMLGDADRWPPLRASVAFGGPLAFWRVLSAADTAHVATALARREGRERVVAWWAQALDARARGELMAALAAAPRGGAGDPVERLLRALADEAGREAEARGRGTAEDTLRGLRVLLETGALPVEVAGARWAGRGVAWLERVLVQPPAGLAAELRAWARAGRLTPAVVEHFPGSALHSLVGVIAPEQADDVARVIELSDEAQRVEPWEGVSADALHRGTWTVVLDYLLEERGSVFNRRSFLAHTLRAMAARHGLAEAEVRRRFLAVAGKLGPSALQHDLLAVAAEAGVTAESVAAGAKAAREPVAEETLSAGEPAEFTAERLRRSTALRLRLVRRALAGDARASSPAVRALWPILWRELAADPTAWGDLLAETEGPPGALDELVRTGGAEALEALMFAGDERQAGLWRDWLEWVVASPAGAACFPKGTTDRLAGAWRALVAWWRTGGGRPIADLAGGFDRLLATLDPSVEPAAARTRLRGVLRSAETPVAVRLWRELRMNRPSVALPRWSAARAAAAAVEARGSAASPGSKPPKPVASAEATAAAGPIVVHNAGLVILAWFFPRLHERCGLLAEGVFRDEAAAGYAVHLLQYLVAGASETRETALALNKLLCGLTPDTPITMNVELAADHRRHADHLLDEVANRWARGASVSVQGLRRSYLVREGRLEPRDGRWLLRVERRGWDVLLPELDWTFPGPKPAWMPQPLEVDWV